MSDRREWPIVIGGCHRSGTSLLRRMLDAHPRIHCGPEVTFFRDFFGDYRDDPLHHLRFATTLRSIVSEDEALEVLGGALVELHERAARQAGKERWADKSPDNVLYAGRWADLLYGRMLFVHVVRDPLDTIGSMRGRFPLTLPADLEGLVQHWLRYTAAGVAFTHAHPKHSTRILYEELCAEPPEIFGRLMDFLGEQFDAAQLTFNRQPHQAGLEDPNVAATQTVHGASIGRWATDLSPEEAELVRTRTADLWSIVRSDGK